MPNDRKEEILAEAVQLFLKKGYERTSLRDLGKAVGMQAPGIYYYFKSKKDILYQIHQDSWQKFREMVLDRAQELTDPEEKIRVYVSNMIKFQLVMAEKNLMADDSVAAKTIKGRKGHEREVFDFLRGALGELAAAKGLKNTINLSHAAFALFAMVSRVYRWYKPNDKLSPEELTEEIIRLFFFGFCGSTSMPQSKDVP
jgi:TetR/AcrR family transcriptional regulator, cholesterol catabolism regulator